MSMSQMQVKQANNVIFCIISHVSDYWIKDWDHVDYKITKLCFLYFKYFCVVYVARMVCLRRKGFLVCDVNTSSHFNYKGAQEAP